MKQNEETAPSDTAAKESILVIDDSADTLSLEKLILEMEGFQVYTAQSGKIAFDILSKAPALDLILLDMRMDDMSGIEFLNQLEQRQPDLLRDVPVVFHTAMDKIPETKAAGCIRKPADLKNFVKEVHQFVEMGHHPPYKH